MTSQVFDRYRSRRARNRYHDAEQRFFDAYGRGGSRAGSALVISLDYFARVDVTHTFHAWLSGRASPLDVDALEHAWLSAGARGNVTVFYRNLAHFLSLL